MLPAGPAPSGLAAAIAAALDALDGVGAAGVSELRARLGGVRVGVWADDAELAALLLDGRAGEDGDDDALRARVVEAERIGAAARRAQADAVAALPEAEGRVAAAREDWLAAEGALEAAEARLTAGSEAVTTARQHHAAAELALSRAGTLPWFLVRREGRLAAVLALLLGWIYAGVARRVAAAHAERRAAGAAVIAAVPAVEAARKAVRAAEAAAVTCAHSLAAARRDRDALLARAATAGHDAARAAQAQAIARADLAGLAAARMACARVAVTAAASRLLPAGLTLLRTPDEDLDGWLLIGEPDGGDDLAGEPRPSAEATVAHLPGPLADLLLGERLTGVDGPATARVAALLADLPVTLAEPRDRRLARRVAERLHAELERSPDPSLHAAAERLASALAYTS